MKPYLYYNIIRKQSKNRFENCNLPLLSITSEFMIQGVLIPFSSRLYFILFYFLYLSLVQYVKNNEKGKKIWSEIKGQSRIK